MAKHTNMEVFTRFIQEAGRTDAHFLTRGEYDGDGWRVEVDRGTHTLSLRRKRIPRTTWNGALQAQFIPMMQFAGKRHMGGTMVVNGDGFDDEIINGWQERMRETARADLGNRRVSLLPYAALTGAQIDRSSVIPIEVSDDRNENFEVFLPSPFMERHPPSIVAMMDEYPALPSGALRIDGANSHNDVTLEFTHEGVPLRVRFTRSSLGDSWSINRILIWAAPEFGVRAWQRCAWATERWVLNRDGVGEYLTGWFWVENIHRLGAVVFSGITAVDGRRHRYLSAFDMQEPNGLYFLAMLPDRGACKTYAQALDLLAPDMVHQARKEGRNVYRQGDVFAIETKRTNEEVYAGAVTRVRRHVVLQSAEACIGHGIHPYPPLEGEVVEESACPFCAGHTLQSGWGERARVALSIHRTGHTASEVVVKEGGVTYIRGDMFHDPWLEDPERANADHRPIQLGSTEARVPALRHVEAGVWIPHSLADAVEFNLDTLPWFVAIRNTVPKIRPRSRPNEDSEIVAANNDARQLRDHRALVNA